jgi:hypothetical protein
MYRLNVSSISEDKIRVRCKNKNYERVKTIHLNQNFRNELEYSYQVAKALRECLRDILFLDFGHSFRLQERRHHRSLNKSFVSAAKRAKLIKLSFAKA